MFTAELVGGPKDGEIIALPEDLMVIKFAVMMGGPEFLTAVESAHPTALDIGYIQYLRTKRRSLGGRRIYQYVPPNQFP